MRMRFTAGSSHVAPDAQTLAPGSPPPRCGGVPVGTPRAVARAATPRPAGAPATPRAASIVPTSTRRSPALAQCPVSTRPIHANPRSEPVLIPREPGGQPTATARRTPKTSTICQMRYAPGMIRWRSPDDDHPRTTTRRAPRHGHDHAEPGSARFLGQTANRRPTGPSPSTRRSRARARVSPKRGADAQARGGPLVFYYAITGGSQSSCASPSAPEAD